MNGNVLSIVKVDPKPTLTAGADRLRNALIKVLEDGRISAESESTIFWDSYKNFIFILGGNNLEDDLSKNNWLTEILLNGNLVVYKKNSSDFQLWSSKSWEMIIELKGHSDHIIGILATLDNKILSWSKDCTLRLWDGTTGECLSTMADHTISVSRVEKLKSTNGLIISWCANHDEIRLWDIYTGQCLSTLKKCAESDTKNKHYFIWNDNNGIQIGDQISLSDEELKSLCWYEHDESLSTIIHGLGLSSYPNQEYANEIRRIMEYTSTLIKFAEHAVKEKHQFGGILLNYASEIIKPYEVGLSKDKNVAKVLDELWSSDDESRRYLNLVLRKINLAIQLANWIEWQEKIKVFVLLFADFVNNFPYHDDDYNEICITIIIEYLRKIIKPEIKIDIIILFSLIKNRLILEFIMKNISKNVGFSKNKSKSTIQIDYKPKEITAVHWESMNIVELKSLHDDEMEGTAIATSSDGKILCLKPYYGAKPINFAELSAIMAGGNLS